MSADDVENKNLERPRVTREIKCGIVGLLVLKYTRFITGPTHHTCWMNVLKMAKNDGVVSSDEFAELTPHTCVTIIKQFKKDKFPTFFTDCEKNRIKSYIAPVSNFSSLRFRIPDVEAGAKFRQRLNLMLSISRSISAEELENLEILVKYYEEMGNTTNAKVKEIWSLTGRALAAFYDIYQTYQTAIGIGL